MSFTTVIFDWSNVLGTGISNLATAHLVPLSEVPKDELAASVKATSQSLLLGQDTAPAFERLANQLKVPVEEIEHAYNRIETSPTLEYVRTLKARKILASNKPNCGTELIKEELKGFSDVFLSCDLGIAKPDPVFFTTVLERAGVTPQECVFVDDKEKNVEVARALSITAILYKDLDQLRQELKALDIV